MILLLYEMYWIGRCNFIGFSGLAWQGMANVECTGFISIKGNSLSGSIESWRIIRIGLEVRIILCNGHITSANRLNHYSSYYHYQDYLLYSNPYRFASIDQLATFSSFFSNKKYFYGWIWRPCSKKATNKAIIQIR